MALDEFLDAFLDPAALHTALSHLRFLRFATDAGEPVCPPTPAPRERYQAKCARMDRSAPSRPSHPLQR
jgi:hypothetical protein